MTKETLTENRGFTWFPFDTKNWLTSADVMCMTAAEEGNYVRCLAVQWRDGFLHRSAKLLAQQMGRDYRSVKSFLNRWAHLFYTVAADGSIKPQTVEEWREFERNGTTRSEMAEGSEVPRTMVNPKLLNLSQKQANLAAGTAQNKRERNGHREEEQERDPFPPAISEASFHEDGRRKGSAFDLEPEDE